MGLFLALFGELHAYKCDNDKNYFVYFLKIKGEREGSVCKNPFKAIAVDKGFIQSQGGGKLGQRKQDRVL